MLKDKLRPWAMKNLTTIVNVVLEYGIEDKEFGYGRDGVIYWTKKLPQPLTPPEIILERDGPLEGLEEEGLLSVRIGERTGTRFFRIEQRGIRAVEANFKYPTLLEEFASSIHNVAQPKMSTLPLTDRQKELIRSLGPGLKSGDVKTTWGVLYGDGGITDIGGLGKLWQSWKQQQVKEADLAAFVDCKFLTVADYDKNLRIPNRYLLNKARIEQAIEQDFHIEPSTEITNINLNVGGDISGQVNVAGHDIIQTTQEDQED